jgi:hypothetical protein
MEFDRFEVFTRTTSRYLASDDFQQYETMVRWSGDELHTLTLFDGVIGLVCDRRDEFNYHAVSFHAALLSEFGEQKLIELCHIAQTF